VVGSLCCRNRSYGSHDLLLAGGDRQGTPRQSYLAFDLPDLRGRQIVRAQLRLTLNRRQSRGAEAMEILVYPVTRPWAPATTTWHHQPGAQGAPLHRGWTRPQVNRITTIDVTELVRHWATGTVVNHGLLLRPARPTADQTVAWYAQESPWETRRPLLELEIGG
jgi:hypothetical protein